MAAHVARHMRGAAADGAVVPLSERLRAGAADDRVQTILGVVLFVICFVIPFVILCMSGGVEHERRYVPAHYETVLPRD